MKSRAIEQRNENTPGSLDATASELEDYAALAQHYRKEIDGLGGFDAALIDEAKELAAALRDRPGGRVPLTGEAREEQRLRHRMLSLLWGKMQMVRSAARFVFRGRPESIREVTSAYERRKRAAARAEPNLGAPSPEGTGATAGKKPK